MCVWVNQGRGEAPLCRVFVAGVVGREVRRHMRPTRHKDNQATDNRNYNMRLIKPPLYDSGYRHIGPHNRPWHFCENWFWTTEDALSIGRRSFILGCTLHCQWSDHKFMQIGATTAGVSLANQNYPRDLCEESRRTDSLWDDLQVKTIKLESRPGNVCPFVVGQLLLAAWMGEIIVWKIPIWRQWNRERNNCGTS